MGIKTEIEEAKTGSGWIPRHEIFIKKYYYELPHGCCLVVRGIPGSNWEILLVMPELDKTICLGDADLLEDAMEDAPVSARSWLSRHLDEKRETIEALNQLAGSQTPESTTCVCGHGSEAVSIEFDGEAYVHQWIPGCELIKAKAEIAELQTRLAELEKEARTVTYRGKLEDLGLRAR